MIEAGGDSHGVEGECHAQVTESQVNDKELSWFQQVPLPIGDVQQDTVPT